MRQLLEPRERAVRGAPAAPQAARGARPDGDARRAGARAALERRARQSGGGAAARRGAGGCRVV